MISIMCIIGVASRAIAAATSRASTAVVVIVVIVVVVVVVSGTGTVSPEICVTPIIRPGARCSMGMCIPGGGGPVGGGGAGVGLAAHVRVEVGFRGGLLRVGVGVGC